jgi:phosphoserine phosphatase RsbU/P
VNTPFHRLRWRLLLWLGGAAVLLLLAFGGIAYALARERILQRSALELLDRQQRISEALAALFDGVERRTRELAVQLDAADLDRAQLLALLQARVLHDGALAQVGVMTEADNPLYPGGRFAVTVTYGAEGLAVIDFISTGYDYWNRDWYRRTLASQGGWWSDPYFNDAAGGQDTITYDLPLRDASGRAYGMLGMSVSLDRIAEIAAGSGLQQDAPGTRYALADARGQLLLAWDPALERAYRVEAAAQRSSAPLLAALARLPADAGLSLQRLAVAGAPPQLLAMSRVPPVGWAAALAWSHDDLLEPLDYAAAGGALLALLLLVLLPALATRLARRIEAPLHAMTAASERLAAGDMTAPVAVAGDAGLLQPLAGALERARQRQQQQQLRLQAIDDAQRGKHDQRDLAIQLQRALLPQDRVFFGPRLQAELVGVLQPGQSPGGDSYGFLAPAPGVCLFHYTGVQAAGAAAVVAMSRVAGLLAAAMRAGGTPAQILQRAHEALQQDDDGNLRAAVVVGRLDLGSGELQLAAAGEGGRLLLRRADGRQQRLALAATPPLQREASAFGETLCVALQAGDRLVLPGAGLIRDDATVAALQVALERHADHHGARLARDLVDETRDAGDASGGDRGLLVLSLQERD